MAGRSYSPRAEAAVREAWWTICEKNELVGILRKQNKSNLGSCCFQEDRGRDLKTIASYLVF